jgi:hypothetical protein
VRACVGEDRVECRAVTVDVCQDRDGEQHLTAAM